MTLNNTLNKFDSVILGAGIYGLYAALLLAKKSERLVVIEYESEAFKRASNINQARVHYGYHYPRSFSTAIKSANYFNRFVKDFDFAINNTFKKIYGIAQQNSMTSSTSFKKFCSTVGIKCEPIRLTQYFKNDYVEDAFETEEYAFDAMKIKDYLLNELKKYPKVKFIFNDRVVSIKEDNDQYILRTFQNNILKTNQVINATYASTNQVLDQFGFEKFQIKYEICEVIICDTSNNIKDVGITLMDGPFFSIMPFGLIGKHSLTSVSFTPHKTSFDELPTFSCQSRNPKCTPNSLRNCNECPAKPVTSWPYMFQLAKKYLNDDIEYNYQYSLFTIKPILRAAEVDDSRPTIIKTYSNKPKFISVFSGKINTIYDLDEILC